MCTRTHTHTRSTDVRIMIYSESNLQTLRSETQTDQCSRQNLSITASSTWFPSRRMHLLACWLSQLKHTAATATAAQTRLLSPKRHSPDIKEEEETNTVRSLWHWSVGLQKCSSEINLHHPTGLPVRKGRAYLDEVWAFLLTTSRGQRLKGQPGVYFKTQELDKMIRKEKQSWKESKNKSRPMFRCQWTDWFMCRPIFSIT